MKSAILPVIVAASLGAFASGSYAQEVKKLEYHPTAAADQSLQQGSLPLPSKMTTHAGEAGNVEKPKTGEAVKPGGTLEAHSKQGS
jgi:hypothetical protein